MKQFKPGTVDFNKAFIEDVETQRFGKEMQYRMMLGFSFRMPYTPEMESEQFQKAFGLNRGIMDRLRKMKHDARGNG